MMCGKDYGALTHFFDEVADVTNWMGSKPDVGSSKINTPIVDQCLSQTDPLTVAF